VGEIVAVKHESGGLLTATTLEFGMGGIEDGYTSDGNAGVVMVVECTKPLWMGRRGHLGGCYSSSNDDGHLHGMYMWFESDRHETSRWR
jgi:hypothetical protein